MFTRFLLLFLLFYSAFSWSESAKQIQWFQYDLPPYHILRGQYIGKGPLDYMLRLWQQTLPEYQHSALPVNTTRMLREFTSNRNYRCITGSFVFPISMENWVWSKPIYVEPPAVIVTRQDVWKKLKRPDSIDFDSLLKNPNLIFGHFDGRIYSGEIDQKVQSIINNNNIITIATHASGESLMKMLHRERVDYILEYLPEIHWLGLSKQLGYTKDFATIKLKNHKTLMPVHVGCVKTEWGEGIINRLNQVITVDNRKLIWHQYKQWLKKTSLKKYFDSVQVDYFNELNDEM